MIVFCEHYQPLKKVAVLTDVITSMEVKGEYLVVHTADELTHIFNINKSPNEYDGDTA